METRRLVALINRHSAKIQSPGAITVALQDNAKFVAPLSRQPSINTSDALIRKLIKFPNEANVVNDHIDRAKPPTSGMLNQQPTEHGMPVIAGLVLTMWLAAAVTDSNDMIKSFHT
jgi:hypothetical protein